MINKKKLYPAHSKLMQQIFKLNLEKNYGFSYAAIELIRAVDFENTRRYIIGEDVVRSLSLNVIADSSAYYGHE